MGLSRWKMKILNWQLLQARIQKFFKGGGGVEKETFERKIFVIHVSTRVHIITRQKCNSFSLLPFQEYCLLFFAMFYYSFFFLKCEGGGGCNPRTPHPCVILDFVETINKTPCSEAKNKDIHLKPFISTCFLKSLLARVE